MSTTRFFALIVLTLAAAAPAAHAAGIEIHFYPSSGVWLHDIDSARQYTSAVIHNTAVINSGSEPITLKAARFEVLRGGQVILSEPLDATALDSLAKRGAAIQKAGMLEALPFQFAPDRLFGKPTALAPTRTLPPGAALLIMSQLLVFTAPADTVRIIIDTEGNPSGGAIASVSIRGSAAAKAFRFPLEGRWLIGAGATPHNHHRWTPAEEFALDIVRVGASGNTHAGDGASLRDYYGWGAPVLAAADGEVVAAVDKYPDNVTMLRHAGESIADYRKRLFASQDEFLAGPLDAIAGNHIIVRHEEGLYSVYAHVQRGTVAVKAGQKVHAGEKLGSLGSSGNSTEPHLHFHVCDSPHPLNCAAVPVRFDNIEIPWAERERQVQSGDMIETH